MIPALIVFTYLAIVLYIGMFAFRKQQRGATAEEFFVAGRSLGPVVFLLSLFGTNMTAFTILGSAGHAFGNGILTFGLMASASAFVIPLCLFLFGTRIWALGRRFGFITPVQMYRDRWECGHIGTFIFVLQAALLVPYIIIGVMGGGTALSALSGGVVPYWAGGAIVALVVMSYVFMGGMRGTALVNAFQTVLFLSFGLIAVIFIGWRSGGFSGAIERIAASPDAWLLTRERVSPWYFFAYSLIPLSTIAFPHISIFCLTAKRMKEFKRTIVLYPICILAIWLPCVFLGVSANGMRGVPAIDAKLEARAALASPTLAPDERASLRRQAAGDDVVIVLLDHYAPLWLAGLLGAGIMAAVMASDSQILALSTMFTEDVFAYYGGKRRFGEAAQVATGRAFVVLVTAAAYVIAIRAPQSIFDLAVQYAFTGFAALVPLLVGALFWRRSTKWGALAVAVWTASVVLGIAIFQSFVPAPPPGREVIAWSLDGVTILSRVASGTAIFGLLPVVTATIGSAVLMWLVSLATPPTNAATVARYFPGARGLGPGAWGVK
ncbi:MAG: sodium:solute symporter family protein [Acidobacteriota bacterium]|nr:sodium:solute symporter family protein [Acidobacteriota bacterium]